MARVFAAGLVVLLLVGFRSYVESQKSSARQAPSEDLADTESSLPSQSAEGPQEWPKPQRTESTRVSIPYTKGVPLLVDFSASWCGPCRWMEPFLAEFEKKYAGKIEVRRYDFDNDRKLAREFRADSIPALYIVVDGEIVTRTAGARPLAALEAFACPWIVNDE